MSSVPPGAMGWLDRGSDPKPSTGRPTRFMHVSIAHVVGMSLVVVTVVFA